MREFIIVDGVLYRKEENTKEYIIIDGVLYHKEERFDADICPLCGSRDLITHPADETCEKRTGCLKCDKWLESVRLKEK